MIAKRFKRTSKAGRKLLGVGERTYNTQVRDPALYALYRCNRWKKVRQLVIDRDKGMCVRCVADGRLTQGHDVDHKTPVENADDKDAFFDLDNLQYLCRPCHNKYGAKRAKQTIPARVGKAVRGAIQ